MVAGGGIGFLRNELWRSSIRIVCDNMPRGVVARLWFGGVQSSKRSSSGSCMDGGKSFLFSKFWTAGGFSWGAVPCVLSLQPYFNHTKLCLLLCCWGESKGFTYYTKDGRLVSFGFCLFGGVVWLGSVWVLFDPCRLGLDGKRRNHSSVRRGLFPSDPGPSFSSGGLWGGRSLGPVAVSRPYRVLVNRSPAGKLHRKRAWHSKIGST